MEEKYRPAPFIVNAIPFFMDYLIRRNSCENMKKILTDVPPDSNAAKEWTAYCDELKAMYQRGWDLIQKHGRYIEECHRPSMEILEASVRDSLKGIPTERLLGQFWVIKKPNGEQVGTPDLRTQCVFSALEKAGSESHAEPADWELNESDIQIYAPPTEQEKDMLGADEPLKDRLIFRIERQTRLFG